jgi:CheY-like chemotaxis protein
MPTILCIDDIPQVLVARKALLETRGYEVLTADDGPRGIEVARSYAVDAVLLDYDLPGMMGDEVAVILKREHPKLPIVILTGFAWGIPEMLLRISDGYVHKGEDPAVLLDVIEQVLKFRAKPMTPAEAAKQGN